MINRLKLLLPMTFARTISDRPFTEATEFTTNSGAEVPKATIVNPMIKSGILCFLAKDEAPSTSQLAPNIKPKNPAIIKKEERIICTIF